MISKLANMVLVLFFASAIRLSAQAYVPTSPKPPQIAAAKTVFISNDTAAQMADSDKIFDEIYNYIQQQGRFKIVQDPSQADLILRFTLQQASLQLPPTSLQVFALRVVDPKTQTILWSVSNTGRAKANFGMHDKKNQYDVLDEILDYLKTIATPAKTQTN